jgi:biotin synthase
LRHDWSLPEVEALFALPFNDLLFTAQQTHRAHFDANTVQLSTLLSIKTGGCPEDCKYCPQSVAYDTGVEAHPLLAADAVVTAAREARAAGATRFCMGAAWRSPTERQVDQVAELVRLVRAEGLETCATLGMLNAGQAQRLAAAGLDYYNHNLDTSPEHYGNIITTRQYADRLDTLRNVRDAGMNVCCGGIVGMGEDRRGRAGLLRELANLPRHPESVPINMLVQVQGTPLHGVPRLDVLEFVRTIAVARVLMPASYVRLSAGRTDMTPEAQALCFLAGANSIFCGERLLTTGNPEFEADQRLFAQLGLRTTAAAEAAPCDAGPAMAARAG